MHDMHDLSLILTGLFVGIGMGSFLINKATRDFCSKHGWSNNCTDADGLRFVVRLGGISISGENITMNANPGQKIGFTIDGKDAGVALDLTNLKVSTSDPTIATVEGSNSADNSSYSGTVHFLAVGACSLDADDLLADGRDVKASAGLNVVAPATLEIVLDPAGPVAGP